MHEKPVWFTADLIARIPNDFIPKRYLDALNRAAGGQRRSTVDMGMAELLAAPAEAASTAPAPALRGQALGHCKRRQLAAPEKLCGVYP